MIFSYAKLAVMGIVLAGIAGAVIYVQTLRKDLAVSEANNFKLEQSVKDQQELLVQKENDFKAMTKITADLAKQNVALNKSIEDLRERFHKVNATGKKRDVGALATGKPKLVERVLNTGTANAMRCMEVAMGAPLTEKEKNATKKSEINPECPDIHPNYAAYGSND